MKWASSTIHRIFSPFPAAADAAVAQEIEEQGAVLLKNSSNQLPLSASVQSIAIIGSKADTAVLSGGGSAQVQPVGGAITGPSPCPPCWAQVVWDPSSPLKAIQAKAPNAKVQFADGSNVTAAASLAASSQVAIVFVNQWASEGMDESSLALNDLVDSTPIDQDALVSAVAAANPHTIVVIESGGPILMPWLGQVNAVLEAWYPGQNGGPAIADLLFGAANPSGKLPVTFPASDAQLPRPSDSTAAGRLHALYGELLRKLQRRLQMVRCEQLDAIIPLRLRPLLHHVLHHQPGAGQQPEFGERTRISRSPSTWPTQEASREPKSPRSTSACPPA